MRLSFQSVHRWGIDGLLGLIVLGTLISSLSVHYLVASASLQFEAQERKARKLGEIAGALAKVATASSRQDVNGGLALPGVLTQLETIRQVRTTSQPVHHALRQSLQRLAFVFTFGGVCAVGIGLLTRTLLRRSLAHWSTKLLGATQERGRGNLSYRMAPSSTDAMEQLAAGINGLAQRLEDTSRQLQDTMTELAAARALAEVQARKLEATAQALESETITRLQTEEAWRERETQYRYLITNSLQGVIVHVDGIVTFANPKMAGMLGYSRADELVGRTYELLAEPQERERRAGQTQTRLQGKQVPTLYDCFGAKKDGTPIWLTCLVAPVSWHRKEASMTVCFDITAYKKVDIALQEAKKTAGAANEAKSAFLANMSHELRTPLHGILNFAKFGIDKGSTAPPEKIQRYFQHIDQSGEILLSLLNGVLDLADLESGQMSFALQKVNLNELVLRASEECREMASARSLTIRVFLPETTIVVSLDPSKVLQVVRGLLSNAITFSPRGGMIELQVHQEAGRVTVAVADQGMGIPEDELEHIFDKFEQARTTKTEAGGKGLGLAIYREIITAHQGRIWAENRPQGGAMVVFELPLTQVDTQPFSAVKEK